MSGFLRYMRSNIKPIVLIISISLSTVSIVAGVMISWPIVTSLLVIGGGVSGLILLASNEVILNRLQRQISCMGPRSRVRDVDYLVIGDQCRVMDLVPHGRKYVQITAPGRSLRAAFEILRHTWSILKDGGHAVLAVCETNGSRNMTKSGEFSVFDVPFLHAITVKALGLERLRHRSMMPVVFAPLRSFRFLLGMHLSGWRRQECPLREVKEFCNERGIILEYFVCGDIFQINDKR